jgi:hypothetical protein
VLRINFDSETLSWNLPAKKHSETLSKIQSLLDADNCNLLQFQKLHGKLNDFANLCPLTKGFRAHQNEFLKLLQLDEDKFVSIPKNVKTELKFWSNCINAAENSFPIPDLTEDAPVFAVKIFSDAAGAAFSNKNFISDNRGAAAIVVEKNDDIKFIAKTTWPKNFQPKFAHKTHILEAIGVLLPFVSNPQFFINKHVICYVDNLAVVFNWEKRAPKGDPIFENIFKILHLMESTIPCKIYIEHVYRRSCNFSKLVDDLTCEKTTTDFQKNQTKNAKTLFLTGPLQDWIQNPCQNNNLYIDVLDHVYSKINNT